MPDPMTSPRARELALVVGFLLAIGSVPLTQTALEVARGGRVLVTDVFRTRPTAAHLRQFEDALEKSSWIQQRGRPLIQEFLFATLRNPGSQIVLGSADWLFYRPDVRYLIEPDLPDAAPVDSRWIEPGAGRTRQANVARTIVRFRDQLRERGIDLVVMPVPGKPAVYPDRFRPRSAGPPPALESPTRQLLDALEREGVPAVDLLAMFQAARGSGGSSDAAPPLYLERDTHWTPAGARLAARAAAQRLRELGAAPAASRQFQTDQATVQRWGDLLDLMPVRGIRDACEPETVVAEQVRDADLGLLVPSASDRPGTCRFPGQSATVLVLGDSFCRIYQYAEPASLDARPSIGPARAGHAGSERGRRPLLPGSAGFISHLALALGAPVDAIVSDGGASTDVRRRLSTDREILEGKRVVIWEFVERDIARGQAGWEDVPLPAPLDSAL